MNNRQVVSFVTLLACLVALPLQAQNATGYAGYFSSDEGIGVYGYSNGDRSEPNPLAPGVYGESNKGVGVYGVGDTSNFATFYNEGGYFVGGKGLYARGTDTAYQAGYGARIYSDNYRGMYVTGGDNYFDSYFGGPGGISTNGVINRAASTQSLVVNLGNSPIEPGDLVAMAGVATSPEGGQTMLGVAKLDASNQNAVIGVAKQAVANQTVIMEDGKEHVDFQPTSGNAAPQSHLVIITNGLAPAVKISSMAPLAKARIGDKIAVTKQINVDFALVLNSETSRSLYQENAIVIGKMAGAYDEASGTMPMFIDID